MLEEEKAIDLKGVQVEDLVHETPTTPHNGICHMYIGPRL